MELLKQYDVESYTVIDTETDIKNRGEGAVGNMKASPFHPDNHIVWDGWKDRQEPVEAIRFDKASTAIMGRTDWLFVGQNIKFDLLYYLKDMQLEEIDKLQLWDTMIVEYLITGQQSKYASLDKLATKYGGSIKDSNIKQYWDDDVDTGDIPEEEIKPYLEYDLLNTERVFLRQLEKVIELDMIPLVKAQMNALKATTIMEWNGMHFDINLAYKKAEKVHEELKDREGQLLTAMNTACIVDPNPASNDHISLLLFGGKQKVDSTEHKKDKDGNLMYYKSGKRKGEASTRKVKIDKEIAGLFDASYGEATSKSGYYKVGDEVLHELIRLPKGLYERIIVKHIIVFRALSKDLNTYYVGYAKLMWPHDDKIHGTINHCATATGRLSSSKPNLQNISSKDY